MNHGIKILSEEHKDLTKSLNKSKIQCSKELHDIHKKNLIPKIKEIEFLLEIIHDSGLI